VTVDSAGTVGLYTSLVLDAAGNPVVSYHDGTSGSGLDLKVLHCSNPACTGSNSITTPDAEQFVGQHTSLALDNDGNPVVSYFYLTDRDLRVLRCGDPNCAGTNLISTPDSGGVVGQYTSIALDASGNPVVSYYDLTNGDLKVLHCGDATCSPTGTHTITSPDTEGDVGLYTSLVLNSAGNPVVSYFDQLNRDLKVLICSDQACNSSTVFTSPDSGDEVGLYTSIKLGPGGNPVVSYYSVTGEDLRILRCGDATCTNGNTVTSPDTTGSVGKFTSLALDGAGNPVVSYYDESAGNLRVLRCGDATCATVASVVDADSLGDVGQYTSLALDASGRPVISYYDVDNGDLKVLHCGTTSCP
jgi:hypothetical protein